MKKFIIKFFLLLIVLFFGVLLGMQEANHGLLQLKGFDDKTYGQAFQIKKNKAGEVEAAVLGEEITAHDIEAKQKKLEEMKAFHVITSIGGKIADMLTILFQKLVNLMLIAFD
ncbi:MAG TPA: DUF3679 domain-containing protein [Bacillus bacterium]|nr:DUF3679 domain-containing protein [Bacillus sp. (in: firmicutes)]